MAHRQWWHAKSWKLIVLDEAHCTAFSKVGRWLVENLRCKRLGFTATPYRLSSREGMKDCFDNLLAAPIPAKLQEMGFLSPMKYYSMKLQPALEKVRTVDGEFSQSDLSNACNSPQLIAAAVKEWKAKALDTPTLAFCVNVEHANAVAKEFLKNRISSAVVTGNTPTKKRNRLYQSLTDGDIKVLASCMVISIGFDLPIAQTGLMLRPTKSKALHFQQIGRLMRPAPGKDFGLILDQAGNCRRHGLPESISAFRLDEQQEPLEAPMKECPECRMLQFAFTQVCPDCGFEFPQREQFYSTELVELIPPSFEKASKDPRKDAYRRMLKEAYIRGYKPGYATYAYRDLYGTWPQQEWRKKSIECSPADYLKYLFGRDANPEFVRKEFRREFGAESDKILICEQFLSGLTFTNPIVSFEQTSANSVIGD